MKTQRKLEINLTPLKKITGIIAKEKDIISKDVLSNLADKILYPA